MPLGLFGSSKKKKQQREESRASRASASSSSASTLSKKERKALEKKKKELEKKKQQLLKEKEKYNKKKAASKKADSKKADSKKEQKAPKKKNGKDAAAANNRKQRLGAQKVHRGRLFLRLVIKGNKLSAKVDEARDFHCPSKANDANPFLAVSLAPTPRGMDAQQAKQQTKVVKNARKRAVFEENLSFDISSISAGMKDSVRVRIELFHEAGKKKHQLLGCMAFTLTEIEDEDTPTHGWFRFLDEKKGVNQNEPFRVMRKKEITKEIEEIYGTYDAVAGKAGRSFASLRRSDGVGVGEKKGGGERSM